MDQEEAITADNDEQAPSMEVLIPEQEDHREKWTNKVEYLLSMIGYAVGLGNAWRFPYIAYQNGGGAFLIPYIVMLLLAAFPLFFIEVSLGQFCGMSCFEAFNCVPLFKGVGLALLVVNFYIGIYYNVIIAYSFNYFFASFSSPLPWTTCNHTTSSKYCIDEASLTNLTLNGSCIGRECPISSSENYWENVVLHISDDVGKPGGVKVDLMLELFLSWFIICVCTIKGTKSVGKAVYFTATFPYLVLTVLLVMALRLEGATDGIYYFFEPKWSVLGTAKVWQEAASQILLSLSLAIGGLITLSSYNPFDNNLYRDCWIVVAVNSFTSIYAGITIFATLGFMAHKLGKEIKNVVAKDSGLCTGAIFYVVLNNIAKGPGLAFIVYPEAVSRFPSSPQVFSVLFFLMLITLGMDTMFAVTETMVASIVDGFPQYFRKRKPQLTVVVCIIFFILGINITTRAGFYWIQLLDNFGAGYALLYAGVAESVIITQIYGSKRLADDIAMMIGQPISKVWIILWRFVSPWLFLVVTIASTAQFENLEFKGKEYPGWSMALGWLMVVSVVIVIPATTIYQLSLYEGDMVSRMKQALKPNKLWRPFLNIHCTGRYQLESQKGINASTTGTNVSSNKDISSYKVVDTLPNPEDYTALASTHYGEAAVPEPEPEPELEPKYSDIIE